MITKHQFDELRRLTDHNLRYYSRSGTTAVCTEYLDILLQSYMRQKEKIEKLTKLLKEKTNV